MVRVKTFAVLLIGLGLTVGSSASVPQATNNTYRVTTALVAVICPLTVGGSFEARTSAIVGDLTFADPSGVVTGAVQVDLATLETGIGLRDRHMKDVYLEIRRGDGFATARLEEIRIERTEGRTPFQATLSVHGEQRPITGVADLQGQRDGGIRVRARFPISLAAFGIQPPRYLGVGVQDEVQVQVTFTAVTAPSYDHTITPATSVVRR
jgi:polyisoprenoid-binding protein YceI